MIQEQVLGAQKVKWNLWQTSSRECLLLSRPIGGCLCDSITLGEHKWEIADTFCCLCHIVNAGGGRKHDTLTRAGSAWGNFRELLHCHF